MWHHNVLLFLDTMHHVMKGALGLGCFVALPLYSTKNRNRKREASFCSVYKHDVPECVVNLARASARHNGHACHSSHESHESVVWLHNVHVHEYRYDPFSATKHDDLDENGCRCTKQNIVRSIILEAKYALKTA